MRLYVMRLFCRGPRRCRRSRRTPPIATAARLRLSFLLVFLLAGSAAHSASEIRSGAAISVSEGNGLLAVDVDAVASISGVHIDRMGSMFGGATLTGLAGGTNIRLIELPAGDYRWSRIDFPGRLRYL